MTPEQALKTALSVLQGDITFEAISEQQYTEIVRLVSEIEESAGKIRLFSENAAKRESLMPFASLNGQ